MRFVGKRSQESTKFLYFFEDSNLDLSGVDSTQSLIDALSEASATTRSISGDAVTTTRVAAKDSGMFLDVGITRDDVDADGGINMLIPSYPKKPEYRNGGNFAGGGLGSLPADPWFTKRAGTTGNYTFMTEEEVGLNSLFLIRPYQRGAYRAKVPLTQQYHFRGSVVNAQRYFTTIVYEKRYGNTDEIVEAIRNTQNLSGGGYSDGYRTRTWTGKFDPNISLREGDYLIALSNIGIRGTSVTLEGKTGYTLETLPKVGKPGVEASLAVSKLKTAILPFLNTLTDRIEYFELLEGTDYTCPDNLSDGLSTQIMTLPSSVKNIAL